MYKHTVEDFATITHQNEHLPFDVNDMIHICKRKNNAKRDFLFVNKYQGKHYPTAYSDFDKITKALYAEIIKLCKPSDKTLIIGFAETATALSMKIMDDATKNSDIQPNYYIQTTRENIKTDVTSINFEEEHSHAVSQFLYLPEGLDIDTIIMIDDELTTGNTICNMVRELRKLYPDAKYITASILNWQNKANQERFANENIASACLIEGEMKSETPTIDTTSIDPLKLHEHTYIDRVTIDATSGNARCLMSKREFIEYINEIQKNIAKVSVTVDNDHKILVLGTEENMYPAICCTTAFKDAVSQSTTRSPITISGEDNYLISEGIELNSSYDANRTIYLYDIPKNAYEQLIVFTDDLTQSFKQHMMELCLRKNIKQLTIATETKGIKNIEIK